MENEVHVYLSTPNTMTPPRKHLVFLSLETPSHAGLHLWALVESRSMRQHSGLSVFHGHCFQMVSAGDQCYVETEFWRGGSGGHGGEMKIILQYGQNFKRKTKAELAQPPGFKLSAKKMQEASLKKPSTEAWGDPSHCGGQDSKRAAPQ